MALAVSQDINPRVIVDFGWMAAAAWSALAWLRAVRQPHHTATAGRFFAASAVTYLLALVTWAIIDLGNAPHRFPSHSDVIFNLAPILLVAGLFWLHPAGEKTSYKLLQAANLALVAATTVILSLIWLAPRIAASPASIPYLATTIGYWTVHLAGAAFTLLALLSFSWRAARRLVGLLSLSMAALVIAVIPYAYDLLGNGHNAGDWYDVLWFTAPCFMALAAREYRKLTAAVADDDVGRPHLQETRLTANILLAVTIFVLGTSVANVWDGIAGTLILAGCILLAAGLILREYALKRTETTLSKNLQTALESSLANQQRFKDFAEAASDFFVETDSDLKITAIIAKNNDILSANAEQFIGHHLLDVEFPGRISYNPPLEVVMRTAQAREVIHGFEYCISKEGQADLWRRYSGLPYFSPDGHFLGYRVAFQDTTEQKRLEQEHRQKTEELTRVVQALDATQELIFILDSEDRVTHLNPSANSYRTSDPAAQYIGQHYRDVFPLFYKQNADLVAGIKAHVAIIGRWAGEITITYEDSTHVFDTRVAAVPGGGMIFAAMDVTPRKKQEANERGLLARLAEAQKSEAIGKLAGGIAHDFNNMIAAIRSFASLILYDLPEGMPARQFADRIVTTSERATELVKQILLFARARNAEREPVSLRTILDELESTLAPTLPDHLKLYVGLPASLAVVHGNAAQLLQVLMNLCLNAADAMTAPGKIEVTVRAVRFSVTQAAALSPGLTAVGANVRRSVIGALRSDITYHCIGVIDTGSGITEETLLRLYEPFFTTKEKSKGTGLGLAVASSIVSAHEGALVVTTELERGTTFELYLPAAKGEPRHTTRTYDVSLVRGHERILIVDDEIDVADGLALALERLGYETAPVYDPAEALDIFAEDPLSWDVVISDQVMPGIKGHELTRKLKRLNAGLHIILCTGFSDTLTEHRAKAAGASAFIPKPASPETLAETIRRLRASPTSS